MLIICFPICCPKQNKKTCGIANSRLNNNQSKKKHTLNPNWVTGFCDAESIFTISIVKSKTTSIGLTVSPCFIITLHLKDLELLKLIQAYFGGIGAIYPVGKGCIAFRVSTLDHVLKIMDHFDKYPLITQKLSFGGL